MGERRLNLQVLREYKPEDRLVAGQEHYVIAFIYSNNERTEINFGLNKTDRDKHLRLLDNKAMG